MHNHNMSQNTPNETSSWDIVANEQGKMGQRFSEQFQSEQSVNLESLSQSRRQEVMAAIAAPTDAPNGMEQVMDGLRTKHELRILARMSGAGFDNWDRLDTHDLQTFVGVFPSPAEFEGASHKFLDEIEAYNGERKRTQYDQAMRSFKQKVYGEKQTYWEQMQALDVLLGGADEASDVFSSAAEQHQAERTFEWPSGVAAFSQISKSEVMRSRGVEYDDSRLSQDSCLVRRDEGLFGVFDGAGGHIGGRAASQAAAASVYQSCDKYNLKSGADLAYVLNAANHPVQVATGRQGYTTATLAKLIERDGQKMLAYAQVGDSRLYLTHPDGSTELITRDEGEGHTLANALGANGDNIVKQYGEISVSPGDKITLCTDGITGDYGSDLMSESELGSIVSSSRTPEEAAANLVSSARKADDRTAIVFAI